VNLEGRTNATAVEKRYNTYVQSQKKGIEGTAETTEGYHCSTSPTKVLTRTVRKRLSLFQDTLIVEYQGGFRKGKSSTDQIFTLRMLQKQSFEQNIRLHFLFIGFKNAYDSIERNKLYQAMKN
jgi:hypothetical protein